MGRHGASPEPPAVVAGRSPGHGHGHGHGGPASDLPAGQGVTALLTGLVAVAVVLTVTSLVLLWPDRSALRTLKPVNPYQGVTFLEGTVTALTESTCPGTTEDRLPDGTIPTDAACAFATVRLDGADPAGAPVQVNVPPEVKRAGMGVGDRLRLAKYPTQPGEPVAYAYLDYDRSTPLLLLAAVFVLLVGLIARFKGLAALLGLAVVYPLVVWFVMPALRAGENPVLVAVTASAAVLLVVLYLAHGVNAKTTIALLGTFAGLLVCAGLAWWATGAAHLDGLTSEGNYQLSRLTTGSGLGGIVLCGIIIAGLGALNDVTITQASAVWEMRALAPHLSAARLFASGLRVGRDHLASTVYTIAFAYLGSGLPLLLLLDLYQQPFGQAVTGGELAEEIVRTLVGSIGLVMAIPLTTAIAALVAVRVRPTGGGGPAAAPGEWSAGPL